MTGIIDAHYECYANGDCPYMLQPFEKCVLIICSMQRYGKMAPLLIKHIFYLLHAKILLNNM